MDVEVARVERLVFDDGAPVRAASAVVPFAGGWLVAQDDATHGAWVRGGAVRRVRLLPPVDGLDTFEESAGTKHLKPDLEAAFVVPGPEGDVVLLGSGSSPRRTTGVLLRSDGREPVARAADLAPLYAAAAELLAIRADAVNLEGACVVGAVVRWFQRGAPSAGVPTASVDVDLAALLGALRGDVRAADVPVGGARRYALGTVDGVPLAVTDVVPLADGTLLAGAAAEDTPDPREDGAVTGSALLVLGDEGPAAGAAVPPVGGTAAKVEGLAVVEDRSRRPGPERGVTLLATVDADDATAPSLAVTLRVRW